MDRTNQMWVVTQEKSGEFYLWVKVEVEDGMAWARTSIPKAWKITKDAAGDAWVWIGEHKVEAAIAAAVVVVVIGALIVEPMAAAALIAKGAATRAGSEFVSRVYQQNQSKIGVTGKQFKSMATTVIKQNGANIVRSRKSQG